MIGDASATPRLRDALAQGIDRGLHLGAVAYIEHAAAPLAAFAVGDARPGQSLTPDHLVPLMSMSKPLTAMAVALLVQQGDLDLDAPVATYIPAFAQRDKHHLTPAHLLTHTAGLRASPFNFPDDAWPTILDKINAMAVEPRWSVGQDAGYSPQTGWFVLGELVARVAQAPLPEFLRARIFDPLDMPDTFVGMPDDDYTRLEPRIAPIFDTIPDQPAEQRVSGRAWATGVRPGGNGIGTLADLARFYRALLDTLAEERDHPWSADTVRRFTARTRTDTFDRTFKHAMDWGLGFMLNNARHGLDTAPYNFGPAASDDAFGHGGYRSSIVFADPPRDLVVALFFNGWPTEAAHHRRANAALAALEADLAESLSPRP
ncbi:MAG: serine hydrolase domain-containing protein [Planctomycetota bacterium]